MSNLIILTSSLSFAPRVRRRGGGGGAGGEGEYGHHHFHKACPTRCRVAPAGYVWRLPAVPLSLPRSLSASLRPTLLVEKDTMLVCPCSVQSAVLAVLLSRLSTQRHQSTLGLCYKLYISQ